MANVYRYLKSGNPEAYRLDPTGTHQVSMGDLVIYDGSAFYARTMAADSEGPYVIGIAEGVGPTPASVVDNAPNLVDSVKVRSHGIFTMKKTTGDSLVHSDPLKMGADAQTVALATLPGDAALVIGYVWNPMATGALTGAGTVDMVLKVNRPATGVII